MSTLKMQSLPQTIVKAHDTWTTSVRLTEKALAELTNAQKKEETAIGQLVSIFQKRGMVTPMHFVSPSTNPDCQITPAIYDDLLALCKTRLPAEIQWLIEASDEDINQRCVDQKHEGVELINAVKAMTKARTIAKKQPQSKLKDLKVQVMKYLAAVEKDQMSDEDKDVNEHNNAIDKDIEKLAKMSKKMDQRITGDNADKIVADCQKAISGLIGALNASKIVDPIPTTKY